MLFSQVNYLKLIFKNIIPQNINLIPLPLHVGRRPKRHVHIAIIRQLVAPVYY